MQQIIFMGVDFLRFKEIKWCENKFVIVVMTPLDYENYILDFLSSSGKALETQ